MQNRLLHALIVVTIVLLACGLPGSSEGLPTEAAQEVPAPPDEPAAPDVEAEPEASPDTEEETESEAPAEPPAEPQDQPVADAEGCTHYVSLNGDDGGTGSSAQPWRTIWHAAESASPGTTVCVTAGTYPSDEGIFEIMASGTADQPITFTTLENEVILQGMLELRRGASHLRFHGFNIENTGDWGLTLFGENEDIILSGLEVSGGETAVHFTVGDSGEEAMYGPVNQITLRDSIIHDVVYTAVDCTPGPCNDMTFQNLEIYGAGLNQGASYSSDGLAVERGRNILVEDCYIHGNTGDGIDLNSRDQMRGDDAGTVIVRRNRVENNMLNGIKLWRGGELSNNVVWNMGETLLVIDQGSEYDILNNTFATSFEYVYLVTLGYDPVPGETTVRMFNNIFYNDDPAMGGVLMFISPVVELQAGHNLYYNSYREDEVICFGDDCFSYAQINDGTYAGQTGFGEASLYADPLFVDPQNGGLHLSPDSPALGAGNAEYAPDIGANEPGS